MGRISRNGLALATRRRLRHWPETAGLVRHPAEYGVSRRERALAEGKSSHLSLLTCHFSLLTSLPTAHPLTRLPALMLRPHQTDEHRGQQGEHEGLQERHE